MSLVCGWRTNISSALITRSCCESKSLSATSFAVCELKLLLLLVILFLETRILHLSENLLCSWSHSTILFHIFLRQKHFNINTMNKGSSGKERKRRKRVVLSIKSKLLAINRIENGESVRTLALELGVSESTIKGWQKCRKEYEEFCIRTKAEGSIVSRSTCKRPTLQVLDQALWLWFKQERKRGTQITGVILKGRALYLNNIFGENSVFTASEGWLHRWKRRHGVYQTTYGDKLSGERTLDADIPEDTSDILESKIDLLPETSCKIISDIELSEKVEDALMSSSSVMDRVSPDNNHDDDDNGEELGTVSHSDGEDALDIAVRYLEQQTSSSHIDVITLIKWRDYAKTKRKAQQESNKLY